VLRFPLLGVPVGIHLSFLLIALFGFGRYRGIDLAAWVLGVGLAVLCHEAGHAFTARGFGARGVTITLFALGGFTTWAPGDRSIGPGRRFVIAASGSAVGIALGGALLAAHNSDLITIPRGVVLAFADSFVLAALVWGIFNWLPMLPLDGGHMAQSLLELFVAPATARTATRILTVLSAAAAAAVLIFVFDAGVGALWIGLIALLGMRSGDGPPAGTPEATEPAPQTDDAAEVVEPVDRDDPPPFPI
jgi:Zn-dependent protease